MTDILTPLATGTVVELGNRIYRKQVLPLGSINYEGRRLEFDEPYLRDVADSFRARAFDTVPFVLAGDDNGHTMAAERGRFGEVLGMDVDLAAVDDETGLPAPGLYSTVRLSEEAESIVQANKRFGVSVRVKENYDRPDGRSFRRACQHVLGTWDPKVTGMAPWSAVELSNTTSPATAVLDLSGLTYTTEKGAPMPDTKTKTDPTPAATQPPAWFLQWLAAGAPVPTAAADATGDDEPDEDQTDTTGEGDTTGDGDGKDEGQGDGDDDLSDEAFARSLAGLFPDAPADTAPPAAQLVAASQGADGDVELANAARDERLAAVELSNRQLQSKLDAAEYEKERAQLVRQTGLPPAVVDLARPLLEGSGRVVELANGTGKVDAGEIVRGLMTEFSKVARLLDLSEPVGPGEDLDGREAAAERRKEKAAAFTAQHGLG